jgi:hypothetical protein
MWCAAALRNICVQQVCQRPCGTPAQVCCNTSDCRYGAEKLQGMVRHHIALGQWFAEQVLVAVTVRFYHWVML